MAQKGFSSSLFWIKQVGLALLLIIIAGVLIVMQDEAPDTPETTVEPEKKSVASGLSEFYREFRMTSSKLIEEDEGDFVVDINDDSVPLESKLQAMTGQTRPVTEKWVGEHKHRSYESGSTLREAISSYAQQEGMQVIWDLDQDFVIKHHFQINDTIAGSLANIANAIDANFDGEVRAYLCPRQRTLVVTAEVTEYVTSQCQPVSAN